MKGTFKAKIAEGMSGDITGITGIENFVGQEIIVKGCSPNMWNGCAPEGCGYGELEFGWNDDWLTDWEEVKDNKK